MGDVCYGMLRAAACVDESDHFLVVPYIFLSTNIRTKSEPKFCVIRAFSMEMSISLFFVLLHADWPKQFV